ncbi:hypothetical protein [Paraburkholderia caribensis]|uniref:DNA-binding protein n=1 Tax=Paraburkholderia caribensis TaxID=75105 RepID=A0A9Q6S2R1_9BURK|nr:hypothetical protein [Paraburkholderia caribensis]QLB63471.1 hypothetical protein A9O66_14420 [Paraburkholderia caribensis]
MGERVLIGREAAAAILNLSVPGLIGQGRKGWRPFPIRQGHRVVYDLADVLEVKGALDWLCARDDRQGNPK